MVTLPEARTLDYGDVARLLSYSARIVENYLQLGGYRTPAPAGADMLRLRHEARIWTREVSRRLSALAYSPQDLPRLLDAYDIMHRIGFRKPDDEFLREMRLCISSLRDLEY